MLVLRVLSCLGAFFIVLILTAIGTELAGSPAGTARLPALLSIVAAIGTWLVFPSNDKSSGNKPDHSSPSAVAPVESSHGSPKNPIESSAIPEAPAVTNQHWALALGEYEGGDRDSGLYARLYAELDGDEARVKAAYLKERVIALSRSKRPAGALGSAARR